MTRILEGLVVDPERMRENLERSYGLVYSQRVLLALTDAGLPRQAAYEVVQRDAMRAWRERRPFLECLQDSRRRSTRHPWASAVEGRAGRRGWMTGRWT